MGIELGRGPSNYTIDSGGLTFLLKRLPRKPSLSPEQRHDKQKRLEHEIPNEWRNFVSRLAEKGADLFKIQPAKEGPVEVEGFLCLTVIKGKKLGHRVVPIVCHDGTSRPLRRANSCAERR